jgi:UDP-N-acetylglucosamine 2-epimerase
MSRVIAELDRHTDHILVHTGQNHDYELNQLFFEDLEIRKPDFFLEAMGDSAAKTIARVIERADAVLASERPDALMLYGDTNSCLSIIPAKRRKVPVFHMEAGNRCFDQRVPEELNRKIVDHLSDINLVLTEHARRYLEAEGIRSETIIKTGSHMREVLDHYMPKILASDVLQRLQLERRRYFVFSAHREENVESDENLKYLLQTISSLAETYDIPVIVSTHPRTRKRLDTYSGMISDGRIRFMKPFGFCDYISLQMNSLCVVSDSGTITEEASLLGLPAVTIRNVHERPEGMDVGTLIMAGLRKEGVLDAVRIIIAQQESSARAGIEPVEDYEVAYVSKKILRLVLSYTGYVNRTTWREFG